jgi:site-specific DNA-methyltransferase (cytosine-N4-specific)
MRLHFHWHTYKYFPYEKVLAWREVESLFQRKPKPEQNGLTTETSDSWKSPAYQTTYFSKVVAETGEEIIPLQAVLEASPNGESSQQTFDFCVPAPLNRQSTRYSAHGLHEYRGKFNPQIVRTIGNLLGLQPDKWLLDPFCGSGTTLLESAHIGWNAIGIDINPLGVQIAQAKLASMRVEIEQLTAYRQALQERLQQRISGISFDGVFSRETIQRIGGEHWESTIPNFSYLKNWFTESVLVQIAAILNEIAHIPCAEIRHIFRIILSDILRNVSLQDTNDLRIRRRKSAPENVPAIPIFLKALPTKIVPIVKARQVLPQSTSFQQVLLGDIRHCADLIKKASAGQLFDAAITSPPYLNALPYIDTQRLSLTLLGLISSREIHSTEKRLIGNREISGKERQSLEYAIHTNASNLPDDSLSLCRQLLSAVDTTHDGFRRQNRPGLTYQYFRDMGLIFGQMRQTLRKHATFVLVVGRNTTTLGGRDFVIDTPQLLVSVAKQHGFALEEMIELDTYQRYDVHRNNSIRTEVMIILRAA